MHYKWCFPALLLFSLLVGCQPHKGQTEQEFVDSLNRRAYHYRYIDIDSVEALANEAFALSDDYVEGRAEALNSLAFHAYQQMDFDRVDSVLSLIREERPGPLLLLCADVMEMKTCQRIGDGERFFRVKSHAEDLMQEIAGREDRLSEHELPLWVYAQSEFYIITATYYFYQEQDSVARVELERVLPCMRLYVDTAQWVYYNYMLGPGGLVEGRDVKDVTLQEFDYLFRAYSVSRREGYRYFEANCLQAFATMLLANDSLIATERSDAYHLLRFQHADWLESEVTLPLALARHALSLFKAYDDLFQTACTYRTIGEIYFELGRYEQSLMNYESALNCVNRHHLRYYGDFSPDTLSVFDSVHLGHSVEKEWIADPRILTVPDWISGIRQQLSLTYSALGMKQASDYNRNSYLDLLQATNQNLELESRTAVLERQTRSLRGRMFLCVILLVIAILLALLFRQRFKHSADTLFRELKDNLWSPYKDFRIWNEQVQANLEEEQEERKEDLQIVLRRLTGDKRKNVESRAKVSLVHGIIPFLDRISGEIVRMKKQGKVEPERKEYIIELVDEIERHNDILTEWITMEQGQLNLHISTFPIRTLFQIVGQGHYAFDQKSITLTIEDTEALVKADESLTLFMINTLADNARKFTPPGGSITISSEETDDYVEIKVSDTGCGLSEEDVNILMNNHVYDAAKIGTDKEGKGFGFGLMNCRGIIEKYKKISSLFACCTFGVRSKLGEGSTFYFRLPRVLQLLILFMLMPLSGQAMAHKSALYDSVYHANLSGRYADVVSYAHALFMELNRTHPSLPPIVLEEPQMYQRELAEIRWAQNGIPEDYNALVELRNEVALAALALNDWELYRYNNRACVRLHRYLHQDKTLPVYFRKLQQTHRNGNILLVLILLVSVIILFFSYKLLVSGQMQKKRRIEALRHYLQHLFEVARQRPAEHDFMLQTADYPEMRKCAMEYQVQVADEAVRPINRLQTGLMQIEDELAKLNYEQNRLYIQNQVLDNCLSTIKHESMYYPSRIRLLAEKMQDEDINQLSELVQYYRHIYTLLCRQADAQINQPGFKRHQVTVGDVLTRAADVIQSLFKRAQVPTKPEFTEHIGRDIMLVADESILGMLFESLLTGMMHEHLQLTLLARDDGDFVRFTLRDSSVELSDEALDTMFFPQAGHISYLVAKQILREHDTYSNHPGCRLVAQQAEGGGYEIFFTLLKMKENKK